MTDQPLSLSELAERSGIEARTLRSWMQQGVVPGPGTVGRNASYAPATLTRVLAVKAMREVFGLSLAEIRRELLAADEARIADYAAMTTSTAAVEPEKAGATRSVEAPAASSAAEYLRSLRAAGVFGNAPAAGRAAGLQGQGAMPHLPATVSPHPGAASKAQAGAGTTVSGSPPRAAPALEGSRLSRLAETLERVAGARPSRRKARGEVRLHIPITPDIELTVRGNHTPEEIARFEQVADLLRLALTGGTDDE